MTKTSNSDYVPRKDTEFKEWSDPLMVYLKSKLTDFGIPEDRYGELSVAHGNFTTAYAVAITPETRTPAAIRKKTEMREAFESMLRKFIAEFITNNSKVTDWDRENMHVPIHKTHPTRHPVPKTYPVVTKTERTAPGRYSFRFRDVTSESSVAKPFGVQGAEFGYVITDKSSATYTDFNRSEFDTHTPFEIQFEPSDFGRTVSYAMRWENTRGEKGPWSPVESLVIG